MIQGLFGDSEGRWLGLVYDVVVQFVTVKDWVVVIFVEAVILCQN